jgi:uncharacterized membrane protein YphA (DoxX/SURF4 family)
MTIGRRVYGLGAVALGVPGLIYANFGALGLPVPAHTPGYQILVYASAALLVLAGLAVNAPRVGAIGALALAAYFALWTLGLHLPHALAKPTEWVSWEAIAETTLMTLGGVLAFTQSPDINEARAAAIARAVRPVFGLGLVVFGISEFVYAKFTASLVPTWLPPSQLAWAYVTGGLQIAAGLAIVSGVRARLAAMLLTTMYLGFTLLTHLPRVIAAPSSLGAWGENGVNLVLTGAAWVLADSLARDKAKPQARS